jgi:hypothetical protein
MRSRIGGESFANSTESCPRPREKPNEQFISRYLELGTRDTSIVNTIAYYNIIERNNGWCNPLKYSTIRFLNDEIQISIYSSLFISDCSTISIINAAHN